MSRLFFHLYPPETIDRWADPNREDAPDPNEEPPPHFDWDALQPHLERIPKEEVDLLDLFYRRGLKQQEIANIFGVTQAGISYRIDRAIVRLRFLVSLPALTFDELRADLADAHVPKREREIVVTYCQTTCQLLTAQMHGVRAGLIRPTMREAIELLKIATAEDERFADALKYVTLINDNSVILHTYRSPRHGIRVNAKTKAK